MDPQQNPFISPLNNKGDSKGYLVEGAKLMCVHGAEITELLIPESHNYTSGGKVKANCKDCKACENIPYFGACNKNVENHLCEGFMELEEKWENTEITTGEPEKVNGEEAISLTSILLCKKGGIIIPVTSGQGYEKGVDIEAFQGRFAKVLGWLKGKNQMCNVFGGDPINLNTGNFIYEKEDLSIGGVPPLSFKRFYNALGQNKDGSLGENWNHNYEVHIKQNEEKNQVAICLEDGREIAYKEGIDRTFQPTMGDNELLEREGEGFNYTSSAGFKYIFDKEGIMIFQEDKNGNRRTFTYNETGQLVKVDNVTGDSLEYDYNQENKLIGVKDHTGRRMELTYQYGKLCWINDVLGNRASYNYNEDGKLQSIITPEGIQAVKNEYDGVGRVVKQKMPDGGEIELCYDDQNHRNYIKERNGGITIQESDERFRNIKTIYEDGEEVFDYNNL